VGVTSQIRATLARFKANLIAAEAAVFQREAALQNIIGLPPNTFYRIIPITMPATDPIDFEWNNVVRLAANRRPDLIELKLILEADRQSLILADNQTLPQLDAVALYRWDGLRGRFAADKSGFSTGGNDFTDWSLGINFSVPLYLRRERAQVRSRQLQIARDQANIEQGMHQVRHQLAQNSRNLAQFYSQWEAFKEAREASKINLERQYAALRIGFTDNPASPSSASPFFLNFLNALTDWGNSVSQEAQALAQYNTELVNLERETGTILETHGVYFHEDRFCSIGPKWCLHNNGREYPRSVRPGENQPLYSDQDGDKPSENAFNLDDYPRR
jgi:outer membrane protein TolC